MCWTGSNVRHKNHKRMNKNWLFNTGMGEGDKYCQCCVTCTYNCGRGDGKIVWFESDAQKKELQPTKGGISTTEEGQVPLQCHHWRKKMWLILMRDPWKDLSLMVRMRVQLQQPWKRLDLYIKWVITFFVHLQISQNVVILRPCLQILLQLHFKICHCHWKCNVFVMDDNES